MSGSFDFKKILECMRGHLRTVGIASLEIAANATLLLNEDSTFRRIHGDATVEFCDNRGTAFVKCDLFDIVDRNVGEFSHLWVKLDKLDLLAFGKMLGEGGFGKVTGSVEGASVVVRRLKQKGNSETPLLVGVKLNSAAVEFGDLASLNLNDCTVFAARNKDGALDLASANGMALLLCGGVSSCFTIEYSNVGCDVRESVDPPCEQYTALLDGLCKQRADLYAVVSPGADKATCALLNDFLCTQSDNKVGLSDVGHAVPSNSVAASGSQQLSYVLDLELVAGFGATLEQLLVAMPCLAKNERLVSMLDSKSHVDLDACRVVAIRKVVEEKTVWTVKYLFVDLFAQLKLAKVSSDQFDGDKSVRGHLIFHWWKDSQVHWKLFASTKYKNDDCDIAIRDGNVEGVSVRATVSLKSQK